MNNKKPRKKKQKQNEKDEEKLEHIDGQLQQKHQSSLKKNNSNGKKRHAAKVSFREEEIIEIEDEDVKLV